MAAELVSLEELRIARGAEFTLSVDRWSCGPGEVVGLVGPNGAGKTTLLEALAGLRPVTGGRVRTLGRDPWRHPVAVRSELGFMSDELPLFHMRIRALLRMVSGYYRTWDQDLVEEMLERFKIDPRQHVKQLSKGQGTRLRLITAMAFNPRLLILDEPATGLDLAGRRTLLESVLEVVRDPERSVIVSSHMLQDVHRIADRLLVLDAGAVVREGPTDSLVGEGRTLEEALMEWGAAG